jgi:hypothetical protein
MSIPLGACVAALLVRELQGLRRELEAYPDDAAVWAEPLAAPNPAGTLALHVAGNLQHFIGAVLGRSGYVRDRPREFAARGLPRTELLAELARAEAVVRAVLPNVPDVTLAAPFPERLNDQELQTADFLLHLCVHAGYHLGQVDYHRRLATGNARGVGTLPMAALHSARPAGR